MTSALSLYRRPSRVARPFFDVDRFFDDFYGRMLAPAVGRGQPAGDRYSPRVSVEEVDGGYRVVAELPGVEPEDVDVSLEDHVLTLAGERKWETREGDEEATVATSFRERFRLPDDVDVEGIKATHRHGVLSIELPRRAEPEPEVRTVPIERS